MLEDMLIPPLAYHDKHTRRIVPVDVPSILNLLAPQKRYKYSVYLPRRNAIDVTLRVHLAPSATTCAGSSLDRPCSRNTAYKRSPKSPDCATCPKTFRFTVFPPLPRHRFCSTHRFTYASLDSSKIYSKGNRCLMEKSTRNNGLQVVVFWSQRAGSVWGLHHSGGDLRVTTTPGGVS